MDSAADRAASSDRRRAASSAAVVAASLDAGGDGGASVDFFGGASTGLAGFSSVGSPPDAGGGAPADSSAGAGLVAGGGSPAVSPSRLLASDCSDFGNLGASPQPDSASATGATAATIKAVIDRRKKYDLVIKIIGRPFPDLRPGPCSTTLSTRAYPGNHATLAANSGEIPPLPQRCELAHGPHRP